MNSRFNPKHLMQIMGFCGILISGMWAVYQYKDTQEREFRRAFYEEQISVIVEIFDTLSAMDSANSDQERKVAASKFWAIYQGKGRTFLDSEMFSALEPSAKFVSGCVTKTRQPSQITCENFTAIMSGIGFARVARSSLSKGWNIDFKAFGEEDPWTPPKRLN